MGSAYIGSPQYAPIAQLDRVRAFEARGSRFESWWAHLRSSPSLYRLRIVVRYPRKNTEYMRVVALRRRGLSVRDITKKVPVSKSTVSTWCKDVTLSKKQKQNLFEQWRAFTGQRLGVKANREKREREIAIVRSAAEREINILSLSSFKIAGIMLYWAEGAKTQSVAVSNSDPKIIIFMVRWFNKIFGILPEHLKSQLHIHHGNNDHKIKRYWSQLTGIPLRNFGKSFIKPRGTGHRTNVLQNGIIKIRVAGTGVEDLRYRILTMADKISRLSHQYQNMRH